MQPSPSCLLTTQSQYTLDAQSVRAELLAEDALIASNPIFKGFRVSSNSVSAVTETCRRHFQHSNKPDRSYEHHRGRMSCSGRKTVTPTKCYDVIQACCLLSKALRKLEKRPRTVVHTTRYSSIKTQVNGPTFLIHKNILVNRL